MTSSLSPFKQKEAEETVYPVFGGVPELVDAPCSHFPVCGGCQVQHLRYEDQLAYKREAVRRAFEANEIDAREVLGAAVGMDDPWRYRNKADFNVRPLGGVARLGFTMAGSRGIVEVVECPISRPEINEVLAAFRRVLPEYPDLKRKIHSIIVRSSRHQERAAVLYHTRLKDAGVFRQLSEHVMALAPSLQGAAFVDKGRLVGVGETALTERILDVDYTYSLTSFFQANPVQTEALARTVLELAAPEDGEVVADVYSGVGLFSLQLARTAREVHAIEDTPSSVADARANATMAGVKNCVFHRGQAHEQLDTLARMRVRLSLMVVDPPRSGCSEATLELLARFSPERLVYVSCNPSTLARDARVLLAAGYRLTALVPVDMFPQTTHVECVARFAR